MSILLLFTIIGWSYLKLRAVMVVITWYGSWIYNYIYNQCLSPLTHERCELEYHSWQSVFDTTPCDKVCQWLPAGRWFSPDTRVSFTNEIGHHGIAEILLKMALNTMTLTPYLKLRICEWFGFFFFEKIE